MNHLRRGFLTIFLALVPAILLNACSRKDSIPVEEMLYVTSTDLSPFEQPAWSPDGTKLAVKEFNLPGLGDTRIYLYSFEDRQLIPLTYTSGYYASMSWSPDSKKLVVAQNKDYENERDIQIIDLVSQQITSIGTGTGAVWSPDGQHIVIYKGSQPSGLHPQLPIDIIQPDGTTVKTLSLSLPPIPPEPTPMPVTVRPGDFYFPPRPPEDFINGASWSPDSRWIVVSVERLSSTGKISGDLYVMSVDGNQSRQITSDGWSHGPAWSPDAKTIAYLKNSQSGTRRLYSVRPDGTCSLLLSDILAPESLSWSPDGDQIAYEDGNSIYVLNVKNKLAASQRASKSCP